MPERETPSWQWSSSQGQHYRLTTDQNGHPVYVFQDGPVRTPAVYSQQIRQSLQLPQSPDSQFSLPRSPEPRSPTLPQISGTGLATGNSSEDELDESDTDETDDSDVEEQAVSPSGFGAANISSEMALAQQRASRTTSISLGAVVEVPGYTTTSVWWVGRMLVIVSSSASYYTAVPVLAQSELSDNSPAIQIPGSRRQATFASSSEAHTGLGESLTVDLTGGSSMPPTRPLIDFNIPFFIDRNTAFSQIGLVRNTSLLLNIFQAIQNRRLNLPSELRATTGLQYTIISPPDPNLEHPSLHSAFFPIRSLRNASLDATVLFDTGATTDFIAPSTIELIGARMQPLETPADVSFAGGGKVSLSHFVDVDFSIVLGQPPARRRFYVLPWLDEVGWGAVLGSYTLGELGKTTFRAYRPREVKGPFQLSVVDLTKLTPEQIAENSRKREEAKRKNLERIAAEKEHRRQMVLENRLRQGSLGSSSGNNSAGLAPNGSTSANSAGSYGGQPGYYYPTCPSTSTSNSQQPGMRSNMSSTQRTAHPPSSAASTQRSVSYTGSSGNTYGPARSSSSNNTTVQSRSNSRSVPNRNTQSSTNPARPTSNSPNNLGPPRPNSDSSTSIRSPFNNSTSSSTTSVSGSTQASGSRSRGSTRRAPGLFGNLWKSASDKNQKP